MDSPKLIAGSTTIDLNDYDCQIVHDWRQDKIIHTSVITGKKTVVNKADNGYGRYKCEIMIFKKDTKFDYIATDDVIDFYPHADDTIHFDCIVENIYPFASGKKHLIYDSIKIEIVSDEYILNPFRVETPEADPEGCEFMGSIGVRLSCNTPGSTIYYTTDGSTPDSGDTEYTGEINITVTTTLKAIAYVDDMNDSLVMTELYTKIIP